MLFNTKTKYLLKYDWFTSQKEKSSGVSQVLDSFRIFTSKLKRDLNPEPCRVEATRPTHWHHRLWFTRGPCPAGKRHCSRCWTARNRKAKIAPSSQVPARPLCACAWGDPALTSDQHYVCPCQENKKDLRAQKKKACLMQSLQDPKRRTAVDTHSLSWWREDKRDIFLERKGKTGSRQLHLLKPVNRGLSNTPLGRYYPHMLSLQHTENYLNVMCRVCNPRQEKPRHQN